MFSLFFVVIFVCMDFMHGTEAYSLWQTVQRKIQISSHAKRADVTAPVCLVCVGQNRIHPRSNSKKSLQQGW